MQTDLLLHWGPVTTVGNGGLRREISTCQVGQYWLMAGADLEVALPPRKPGLPNKEIHPSIPLRCVLSFVSECKRAEPSSPP